MLCKICEQKGTAAKAMEHTEKFLDLWKGVDPGIAEGKDSRDRSSSFDLLLI
jgi:hypothetical protein